MRALVVVVMIASSAHADPIEPHCKNPAKLERSGLGTVGCESSHAAEPMPPTIALSLAPLTVKAGASVDGSLVISNGSDRETELYLDDVSDGLTSPTLEIDDASGKRIDGEPCAMLVAMIKQSVHISLGAHRKTAVPFTVHAEVMTDCRRTVAGPIKPGSYTLVVATPIGTVKAPLTVR